MLCKFDIIFGDCQYVRCLMTQPFGNGDFFSTLTEIEVEILVTAYVEQVVTNRRMQSLCDNHPSDLTKVLQSMVERKLILLNGISGRGTKYYINVNFIKEAQHNEESLQHNLRNLQHKE